jgi:hypothetical protein
MRIFVIPSVEGATTHLARNAAGVMYSLDVTFLVGEIRETSVALVAIQRSTLSPRFGCVYSRWSSILAGDFFSSCLRPLARYHV